MRNVLTPLAKRFLTPLRLTAAVAEATTDAGIKKKILKSARTALIIQNEEIDSIMEIAKSLKESDLLIEVINEMNENNVKEQRSGFLSMLLSTLAASPLGGAL